MRTARRAVIVGACVVTLGIVVGVWQPWVDRTPFTAYEVGVVPGENADDGPTPGSCVPRMGPQKIVIYDEDGTKLAQAVEPRQGKWLSGDFKQFAGDCMIVTAVRDVPGGKGTYLRQWAGRSRDPFPEQDLRRSRQERIDAWKTMEKARDGAH
ncbi:hypothetical protein JK359_03925 [Streptomyces actinomycinicus]|uniref:Uncharacterized protein n=1 Tax=Streptomyces actinomycinicus TaxID=1695166 RepID=A0A937JKA6_9ACTN|nr:hypothetical protein [Streptomyces actinomycinicus]MBL1081130.1 hypothetical protein [Streptomyces actinomycinicus]